MKRPRLYRVAKGPTFAIANLSKNHPLWGMPAGLFNRTAPQDRQRVAADFISANTPIFSPRRAPSPQNAKRKPKITTLIAAAAMAGALDLR